MADVVHVKMTANLSGSTYAGIVLDAFLHNRMNCQLPFAPTRPTDQVDTPTCFVAARMSCLYSRFPCRSDFTLRLSSVFEFATCRSVCPGGRQVASAANSIRQLIIRVAAPCGNLRRLWVDEHITSASPTRRSASVSWAAVRFSSSLLAIAGAVLASEEVLLLDRLIRAKEGAALDSQLCPMPRIAATQSLKTCNNPGLLCYRPKDGDALLFARRSSEKRLERSADLIGLHISDLMPTCLSLSRRMLAYYVVAKYPHRLPIFCLAEAPGLQARECHQPLKVPLELVIRVWEAQTQCSPSGLPTFLSTLVIAAGATFSILLGSRVMHFLR
ncbi:hypothetical protein KC323_g240 [Hortaea werneckii]|nr:hypothetical protein KC323_g240 [Hortaea werneckii]